MEVAALVLAIVTTAQFNPPSNGVALPDQMQPPAEAGNSSGAGVAGTSAFQLSDTTLPSSANSGNVAAENEPSRASVVSPGRKSSTYAPPAAPSVYAPSEPHSPAAGDHLPSGERPATGAAQSLSDPLNSHMLSIGNSSQAVEVSSGTSDPAAGLLRQALSMVGENAPEGQPLGLQDAVRRTLRSPVQQRAIDEYWNLSQAATLLCFASEESAFLEKLPGARQKHSQALLEAERAAARATVSEARLAVIRSQQRLASLLNWPSSNKLLLPADLPFTGVYRTYFETLNARGVVPDRLGQIDRILPVQQRLIQQRADAVAAAVTLRDEMMQAYSAGQVSIEAVLKAHACVHAQRRAFLATVRDYNHQIAEYALAVAGPGQSDERLVAMLIDTKETSNLSGEQSVLVNGEQDRGVRQVSNEEPVGSQASEPDTATQWAPSFRRN